VGLEVQVQWVSKTFTECFLEGRECKEKGERQSRHHRVPQLLSIKKNGREREEREEEGGREEREGGKE
jgi:hypothetical protein